MIYTATKNGHTSTLEVVEGDLDAKKKLLKYRREGWQITASVASASDPLPRVEIIKPKPAKRRKQFTTILGYRVALEE